MASLTMRWRRRVGRVIAGIALAATLQGPAAAASPLESDVKAAYLYKLAAFVTWPPGAIGPSEPFRICTAGRDDVADPLAELVRGQQEWGRPIVVVRVNGKIGAALRQCQILFVGNASAAADALQNLSAAPVLIITERGADGRAAVIEFILEGGHVRFVVHRAEADSRHLQISSKLLSVAAAVLP
jgi:hypothetical protein